MGFGWGNRCAHMIGAGCFGMVALCDSGRDCGQLATARPSLPPPVQRGQPHGHGSAIGEATISLVIASEPGSSGFSQPVVWSGETARLDMGSSKTDAQMRAAWILSTEEGVVLNASQPSGSPVFIGFPEVDRTCTVVLTVTIEDHGVTQVAAAAVFVVPHELDEFLASRLKRLAVGVCDRRCVLQAALDEAGVGFADVTQRFALDWFEGDLLLITWPGDAVAGAELRASLADRVKNGTRVLRLVPGARGPQRSPSSTAESNEADPRGDVCRAIDAHTLELAIPEDENWTRSPAAFLAFSRCLGRIADELESNTERDDP